MARPHKNRAAQRERRATIRFTDEDHAFLLEQAAQAGLSPSEFVRRLVRDSHIEVVQAPPMRSMQAIMELNRIGVNLNQLARIGNATGKIPARLPPLLERINALLDDAMDLEPLEALDALDSTDPVVLTGE